MSVIKCCYKGCTENNYVYYRIRFFVIIHLGKVNGSIKGYTFSFPLLLCLTNTLQFSKQYCISSSISRLLEQIITHYSIQKYLKIVFV